MFVPDEVAFDPGDLEDGVIHRAAAPRLPVPHDLQTFLETVVDGFRRPVYAVGMRVSVFLAMLVVAAGAAVTAVAQTSEEPAAAGFEQLESELEVLRERLRIPGMSAAVVADGRIAWSAGFGFADVERLIAATAHTPYGLASVTKPIAAVLTMQLVDERLLDLDAPVTEYGVRMDNERITSRHLLTHSSHSVVGTEHFYDGNRYGYLAGVAEGAAGRSFARLLSERILLPLEMTDTALNPVESWGTFTSGGFDDLARLVGISQDFRHYPDVYNRLSHPYQLDEDYEVVPGMYHLVHSAAAGLNSSVTDLAKFDIALDSGGLLSDRALREMFTPWLQTAPPRSDLNYGLGWYVQEDLGLQLYWHTGRWPPSTSGLYLKVPELGLTFIVLGNTDNLSVPFHGLGNGDVTTSAVALAFFRAFVYPEYLGIELPQFDWSAPRQELIDQLTDQYTGVEATLIERELLAQRQAFASVGEVTDADRLARVDRAVFRGSDLRSDPNRFQTAGPRVVIAPAVPAARYSAIGLGLLIWYGLVALALIWMAVRLGIARSGVGQWLFWLAATLFIGPFAILISHLVRVRDAGLLPWRLAWRLALREAVFAMTGYVPGWAIALWVIMRGGDNPNPLVILGSSALVPLLFVLLVLRVPSRASTGHRGLLTWLPRALWSELIVSLPTSALFFLITLVISTRFLSGIPPFGSPFFLGLSSVEALIMPLALLPLYYWMVRRGFRAWPFADRAGSSPVALAHPRKAWHLVIVSVVAAFAIFTLCASLLS
jgi:CubicO group peptidase (beta-lactamase class C family)